MHAIKTKRRKIFFLFQGKEKKEEKEESSG